MSRARSSRAAQRGMTLIEVMVAGAVLLVAMVGFVATSRYAASATAVGHRRTTTTFIRAELIDRLSVLPRSALAPLASYTGTAADLRYLLDGCFDVDGRLTKRNTGFASTESGATFCEAGTVYRSYVGARDLGSSTWAVGVYAERVDQPCTPATRHSSVGCSGADLLLTD